ncbi:MAG: hypothetical protein QM504_01985 [Pseudomonadota bacterium]
MPVKKLKIGILLESYRLPAWSCIAIERVIKSSSNTIELVILDKSTKRSSEGNSKKIYQLFNKLDEILFKKATDYKIEKSIEHLLADIPTIETEEQNFPKDVINSVSEKNIDILITLSSRDCRGEILDIPKYGIWAYQLGKHNFNRGKLVGFWEAMSKQPITGIVLKTLPGKITQANILYQSAAMTKAYKPALSKQQYHYLAAGILSRQIDLLSQYGEKKFFHHIKKYNSEFHFLSYPDFQKPGNYTALCLFVKYIWNLARLVFRRLFYYEHWYLFYNLKPKLSQTLHEFKKLLPPKDRFWADPHIIFEKNTYYIFIEELMYNTKRGHISVIEMDDKGNCKDPVIILKKDYHLSYPFVFKYENKYYMVPESLDNRTIMLYECNSFPYQWEFKMNLMEDVDAADSTLFFKDNKWWLFTAIEDVKGASCGDELFLFSSDELFSKNWTSHPLNPIVSDVRAARPAGKIFTKNGKIYRPSQDCSGRYGHDTNINEITELSEQNYSERKVAAITPNWDKEVLGTHTLNYEEQLTIVDAYYNRRRFF